MNKIILCLIVVSSLLLGACGEKVDNIKDAISGIDTKAEEAAMALSTDVHSLRDVELSYENEEFTVNQLFKTILRDIQWGYTTKDETHVLKIKGTWLPGLFNDAYEFTQEEQKLLVESGRVTVQLFFVNNELVEDKTSLQMKVDDQLILEEAGIIALNSLYNAF